MIHSNGQPAKFNPLAKFYLVVFGLLVANLAHAEMCKCVDAGKTSFQEQPCKGSGGVIKIRPQSGDAPPATASVNPVPTSNEVTPSVASRATNQLQTMKNEHRLREIELEIPQVEHEIKMSQDGLDTELATLKHKKGYANNNQAGATWEQSISTEMQAVIEKYKTKISLAQGNLDRLRKEQDSLRSANK